MEKSYSSDKKNAMKTTITAITFAILCQSVVGQEAKNALEEIVSLRQEILDRESALVEDDRRTPENINRFRIDLLNAKIDLETERKDFRQVQILLSEIVKLQKQKLEELTILYDRGVGDFSDVAEHRISILKTNIRIERVRALGHGTDQ